MLSGEPFFVGAALTLVQKLQRRHILAAAIAGGLGAACRSSSRRDDSDVEQIGPLLAPATLAARLSAPDRANLAIFYVGPPVLFAKGRIPGAKMLPPPDSDEARKALQTELSRVPKDRDVVLYCGCCPVKSCPNVRPASTAVRALGRSNAWVLDLPTRFATDWTEKGYPVEHG